MTFKILVSMPDLHPRSRYGCGEGDTHLSASDSRVQRAWSGSWSWSKYYPRSHSAGQDHWVDLILVSESDAQEAGPPLTSLDYLL